MLQLVPRLERLGWEVHLWAPSPSSVLDEWRAAGRPASGAPRLAKYSWRTLRHPPGLRARLAGLGRSLGAFRRYLREVDPDVVHANTLHSLTEALVARASGARVLVHSHEIPPAGLKGTVARCATWLGAHQVVAVSAAGADVLRIGRRRPRVVHVASAVPEAPSRRIRSRGDPIVIGSIGVISHRKGSDVFVAAMEQLPEPRERVEIRLIGSIEDSPAAPWARSVVARARAAGILYRERADVMDELRGWDVLVMASRLDPFPLVVLEAMASGVAVVGTAVDGIVEQIAAGGGVLVKPEDPEALARAVAELLAAPERRAALGAAGRQRVEAHFTLDRTAAGMDEAYRSVARGSGGPDRGRQRPGYDHG